MNLRKHAGVLLGAALAVVGLVASLPVRAAQKPEEPKQKPQRMVGPELIYLDHSDTTPLPLREMKVIPPDWFRDKEAQPAPKKWRQQPFRALGSLAEPTLQTSRAPLVGTTAGLSFDGVGVPNYGVNSAPPDTNGAIGATQYVQWVNTAFAVFNKSTGAMIFGPANGNTLW